VAFHRALCRLRVTAAEAVHQLAVFGQRLRRAARRQQLAATVHLQDAVQVVGDADQPRVAGVVLHGFVDEVVVAVVLGDVAVGRCRFHRRMQVFQLLYAGVVDVLDRLMRAAAFQHRHHREQLVEVFQGQPRDPRTAASIDLHQPFGCQQLQRLAQRRTADAEFLAQRGFVDPFARRQPVIVDALAHMLGHLFVQRCALLRRTRGGSNGHGGKCTASLRGTCNAVRETRLGEIRWKKWLAETAW